MKKSIISFFISLILTTIGLICLNPIWLKRVPVDVRLNIVGSQIVNIITTLDSSKNASTQMNLQKEQVHNFKIKKKGTFKKIQFKILDLQNKSNIIISNVSVNNNKIEISDKRLEIIGADYKINSNNIILTPTTNSILVSYSIGKTYPLITFKLFKFAGLSILFFSLIFMFIYYKDKILNFVIHLFPNKLSENLNSSFLAISVSIILFLFTLYLLSYIGFIFHIPIQKFYSLFSLIAIGVFLFFFNRKKSLTYKYILVQITFLISIFIISLLLGAYFYDASWDGRCYHQEAIMLLSNGWNPVFEKPIFKFINSDIWVEHYPKCAEILSANLTVLFNNIEIGKAINFLFAISIFILSFFTFNKFKSSNPRINLLLSSLIILNPVSIGQIRTYYVDFIIYYLFIGIILAIILKEKNYINNKLFLFLSISQLSILCNIKLGGLFYTIILILCYTIYSLICSNRENLKSIFCIISTLTILVLLSGINPYFTNIKEGYHPFYPLAGKGKIDIITVQSPKSFKNKNSIYKLFISTFSDTKNISYDNNENPKLKFPFSIKNQCSSTTDIRIAGFGYFWSGILLLLIPFVILSKNSKYENNKIYYFTIITLWLSVLLNPESWWARYAPQFWFIPIFIIFWKSLNWKHNSKFKKFGMILIFIMLINSLIFECQTLKTTIKFSNQRKEFFKEVKDKNVSIYIKSGEKESICNKLQKITTNLHEITQSEYLKEDRTTYKNIPRLIIYNKINDIGVYKINE